MSYMSQYYFSGVDWNIAYGLVLRTSVVFLIANRTILIYRQTGQRLIRI